MGGPPRQIGPYTVDRELGRGGMGVVYLGRDTRLDRAVAIKALPEHLAQDPERLARFEREAKTLAQLNHPNVAGIHGVEEHEGSRYLVLEYVEGETLADRLDRGALPVDEALEIAIQIAAGVEAAHEAGVIHRDLKPGNVIVTPEGQAKVLDFGLARAEEATSSSGVGVSESPTLTSPAIQHSPTTPGVILGTAAYMSPEQARGRRVDKRTDIWSFGVMLYEMLTGASPFVGESVSDSVGAVLHKEIDLDRLPPATPANVRRALRRCLERDRALRYRDIGDVRIELAESRAPEQAEGGDAGAAGRPWAKRANFLAFASLIAAVASAATWSVVRVRQTEPPSPVQFRVPFQEPLDMSGLAFQTIALSPDGETIVYSGGRSGRTNLYVRRLRDDRSRVMPGTEGARSPFFSGDGQRLGFHSQGQLKWLPMSGGAPLAVASLPGLMFGAEWLPDGSIVFAGMDTSLRVVSPSGGEPGRFEVDLPDPAAGAMRWPRMSPDGTHLIVTHYGAFDGVEGPHILAIDLSTRKVRGIARGVGGRFLGADLFVYLQGETMIASRFDPTSFQLTGQPRSLDLVPFTDGFGAVWIATAPDGTLVYVPASRDRGSGRLVWVDRAGQTAPVSSRSGQYYAPRLSPDQSQIAYWSSAVENASGIFIHDIRQGRSFPVEYRDTFGGSYPLWSRDGRRLSALCNLNSAGWSWQTASADGSGEPEIVLEFDAARLLTSLDPSGRGAIGYEVNPVTNRDIWLLDDQGEMTPLITTDANERAPRISPDGRWFAFVSDRTGQDEVYITSYPDAAGLHLVSANGGAEPTWSPDGGELFYRVGESFMSVRVETDDEFTFSHPVELFSGRYLQDYFGNANYDISSDGERFLMVRTEDAEQWEMHVILNASTMIRETLP